MVGPVVVGIQLVALVGSFVAENEKVKLWLSGVVVGIGVYGTALLIWK